MQKNNLTKGLFAALLLASNVAGADQKYPAADFEPAIVFQDSDYIAKNKSTTESSASTKSSQDSSASNEVDSRYPAANFQPKVVYSDTNYKHSESSASSSVSSSQTSSDNEEIKTEAVSSGKKDQGIPNYLIGLVGLALAGLFLFKKQSKCGVKKTQSNAPVQGKTPSGLTGVARYLNKTSGTGVSRYLEKQVKSAKVATGVARYMAKQVSSAKVKATEAATGVERYMRNRG